jgi:hypothetical protein
MTARRIDGVSTQAFATAVARRRALARRDRVSTSEATTALRAASKSDIVGVGMSEL